jgi:hypothetical protein
MATAVAKYSLQVSLQRLASRKLEPFAGACEASKELEPAFGPFGRLGARGIREAWQRKAVGAFAKGTLLIADHGAAAVRAARPFSAWKRKEPLDRRQ